MMVCEFCGRPATHRKNFRDPRRDDDDHDANVEKYLCDDTGCESGYVDELERQAQFARLVH